MTPISRRTALLGVAAVAGAGIAVPVGTPLHRLADATTSATPDPAIDVDYRIAPFVGTAADGGGSVPEGAATAPSDGESVEPATVPSPSGTVPGSSIEGSAVATATVERDRAGRVWLLTRATTPPVTVTEGVPGESGSLSLAIRVRDEPVFLDVRSAVESLENGITESEAAAGDATPDRGELAGFVGVRVVRRLIPAATTSGVGTDPDANSDAAVVFDGTIEGFRSASAGPGLPVPGDRADGAVSAWSTCELVLEWTFLSSPADFAARGLDVPGDVNVTQTDRLDIDISIDARTVA